MGLVRWVHRGSGTGTAKEDRQVILTDYPDADLIANLRYNVQENIPEALRHRVDVEVCVCVIVNCRYAINMMTTLL